MPVAKGAKRRRKPRAGTSRSPITKLRRMTHPERVRAVRGMFAYVPTSSEEFIARKHAELERENRK
jgi:hypothetical protein